MILRTTLRILLLRGAIPIRLLPVYGRAGRLKTGLRRNAFISYPSRLGAHLVEPAFRTITGAGPGPFVPFERLKFFENFHPQSLRSASLRLAWPRLASPRLTVAADSSPVVRAEEWINSELLPLP